MAFQYAHGFNIENFTAIDRHDAGNVLSRLEQEACLGAGHRSKERFDAPKCHPETRKAVIDDIMSWVNVENSREPIMWLSGPAGAGKSAISQSICERCHEEKKLLASFFFSRTATGTGRDDGNRLIPTIACQIAISVPEAMDFIVNELEKDPMVLSYSMDVQLKKLVLNPLSKVYAQSEENTYIATSNQCNGAIAEVNSRVPHLVVIDGLDECDDRRMQSNIIVMLSNIFSRVECSSRLRFLIASRPELEIRNAFQTSSVSKLCARILLNENYEPDEDIRVYLQSEFASLKREHTLASSLMEDSDWPCLDQIDYLVRASFGQFIYASIIMKYLKHPRRDPRDVLDAIVIVQSDSNASNNDSLLKESPFAQLDALYKQVLGTARSNSQDEKDTINLIFQVLSVGMETEINNKLITMRSPSPLASFKSIKETKLELLLADLQSILFVRDNIIQFYHASFWDFLLNASRSGEFYINRKETQAVTAHYCFTNLSDYQPPNALSDAEEYSRNFYFLHIEESGFNDLLLKELQSAPKLRTILSLIMENYIGESGSPFTTQIKAFFEFNMKDVQNFATPKNEKLSDVCKRLSETIDDIIISSCPSLCNADKTIVEAIMENEIGRACGFGYQPTDLRRSWFAMLLDIPVRGKHLYLNSKRRMCLYAKFCKKSEFRNSGAIEEWHLSVMSILLDRIEPSADIDTDAFREMTKEVLKGNFSDLSDGYLENIIYSQGDNNSISVDGTEDDDGEGCLDDSNGGVVEDGELGNEEGEDEDEEISDSLAYKPQDIRNQGPSKIDLPPRLSESVIAPTASS